MPILTAPKGASASFRIRRTTFALLCGVIAVFGLSAAPAGAEEAAKPLLKAPVSPVPPLFTQADIDRAVAALDGIVEDAMTRTGLPGLAVGVVYKDKVIYAKGFGVREVGKPGAIDPDTVFLLASVSKPIASTIVAKLVGDGVVKWDDPAKMHNPAFALNDPYVTEHATIADLLSHRSGLHTGAGDLLEDLGFDRDYILSHLDQQPLDPFRSTYHYSNFGYTAGGIAAAVAAGKSWEDLADEVLFKPAGMTTASYRHAHYLADDDRAHIHTAPAGRHLGGPLRSRSRTPRRRPAAPAPRSTTCCASCASSSATARSTARRSSTPTRWRAPHVPQVIPGPPRSPASRAGFYGFGWNVSYDDEGRARIGHSGAFDLGTATYITFMPGEDLGVVTSDQRPADRRCRSDRRSLLRRRPERRADRRLARLLRRHLRADGGGRSTRRGLHQGAGQPGARPRPRRLCRQLRQRLLRPARRLGLRRRSVDDDGAASRHRPPSPSPISTATPSASRPSARTPTASPARSSPWGTTARRRRWCSTTTTPPGSARSSGSDGPKAHRPDSPWMIVSDQSGALSQPPARDTVICSLRRFSDGNFHTTN